MQIKFTKPELIESYETDQINGYETFRRVYIYKVGMRGSTELHAYMMVVKDNVDSIWSYNMDEDRAWCSIEDVEYFIPLEDEMLIELKKMAIADLKAYIAAGGTQSI